MNWGTEQIVNNVKGTATGASTYAKAEVANKKPLDAVSSKERAHARWKKEEAESGKQTSS